MGLGREERGTMVRGWVRGCEVGSVRRKVVI